MAKNSALARISSKKKFADGTPRIASERERALWLDGWQQGWNDGERNGRNLERDNARKRKLAQRETQEK